MSLRPRIVALVVGVFALVLSGCHGTPQVVQSYWYLTSIECMDRTSGSTIFNAPYQGSTIGATTGHFIASPNGCSPWARDANAVGSTAELMKQNLGLCGPAYGWAWNAYGNHYSQFSHTVPYFCGNGNYYPTTHHQVYATVGLQTHANIGPGDSYSDGT